MWRVKQAVGTRAGEGEGLRGKSHMHTRAQPSWHIRKGFPHLSPLARVHGEQLHLCSLPDHTISISSPPSHGMQGCCYPSHQTSAILTRGNPTMALVEAGWSSPPQAASKADDSRSAGNNCSGKELSNTTQEGLCLTNIC